MFTNLYMSAAAFDNNADQSAGQSEQSQSPIHW